MVMQKLSESSTVANPRVSVDRHILPGWLKERPSRAELTIERSAPDPDGPGRTACAEGHVFEYQAAWRSGGAPRFLVAER